MAASGGILARKKKRRMMRLTSQMAMASCALGYERSDAPTHSMSHEMSKVAENLIHRGAFFLFDHVEP
jgi:hypothetical protein